MTGAALLLLVAAAAPSADPLAALRHTGRGAECSTTLETVMLLAQLAAPGPAATEFQARARAHFASQAGHPAVRETGVLMERGLGYPELARLSTFMSPAPHFLLTDSEELQELAALLPGGDVAFNLDRLHGYAKLVREFYWDRQVGRFLRGVLSYYQEVVGRNRSAEPVARVLLSPLAPAARIPFARRLPRSQTYLVLGAPAL